jgi:hypothetical protein
MLDAKLPWSTVVVEMKTILDSDPAILVTHELVAIRVHERMFLSVVTSVAVPTGAETTGDRAFRPLSEPV